MKITQSSAVLPFYRYLFIIGLFFLSTAFKKEDTGIRAAYGLIERVTPGYSKQFVLELIPAGKDGQDMKSTERKEKLSCAETILSLWLRRTTNI